MDRNKIIIILLIVVIIGLVAGVVMTSSPTKKDCKIKITSDKKQYKGGKLSIELTDLNKTPISKEVVNITITNKKGKVVVDDVVKTDSKGKAKMDLNLKKGKYVVKVSFGGNENFTGNNTTQKLTIKEKVAKSESTSSSSSSSDDDYVYSRQRGDYVKKSGQMDQLADGSYIYTYQGGDGALYEKYYDSNGKEISAEEHYR